MSLSSFSTSFKLFFSIHNIISSYLYCTGGGIMEVPGAGISVQYKIMVKIDYFNYH